MSDKSRCPTVSDLAALSSGQLSKAESTRLIRHIEDCESCRSAAETLNVALPGTVGGSGERRSASGAKVSPKKSEPPASPTPPQQKGPRATAAGAWSGVFAPPQGADEIGRVGIYRVLHLLGTGGMGAVFAAEDTNLRRKVALKVMKLDLVDDEQARKRFLREARAMAAVQHDRIIAVYGVGMVNGLPYLAMPLLTGESLEARLTAKRRLPLAEAIRIARETAEGLAAAHKSGLVHRDVKPANLWLEGDARRVKILDFGLARRVEGSRVTHSGAVLGTPAFMSPEQARGEPVDHRSDLFSLGSVLYRLATGQLPFGGATAYEMMAAVTDDEPLPPRQVNRQVPVALERLILKLLDKDPAKRPASAAETARELEALEQHRAPGSPRGWGGAVILLLLLGVLGCGAAFLWPLVGQWWDASPGAAGKDFTPSERPPSEATARGSAPGAEAAAAIRKGDDSFAGKQYDKAIKDYTEAIRIDPENARAFNNRGNAWYAKKEYDKAMKDYDEAIRLDPTDAIPLRNRAAVWYFPKKDYDKAIKDYDEAISLDHRSARAFDRRAWILATCPDATVRDGKRAVESATTACKLDDWKKADDLDTLAAAYAEAGEFTSAVKWEEKALEDKDFAKQNGYGARKRLQFYKDHKPYRE
jgi:tetratricopeptide (TPR) repeat protein